MRGWIVILAVALGLARAGPSPVAAQQGDAAPRPAMLVADDVYLEADDRLVATGSVEAIYDGRRLRAARIVYDRAADRLRLTGPIVIEEADDRLILADAGEIDEQLRNGILRGARIVMGRQLQMAAQEFERSAGRYNRLSNVSVTSCRVCETGRPPLWQIRARRVVHDQQARQLYFEGAQLRVLDTPIFYLPRLRLPDPTLERATGFLVPSLRNSSLLGFGARVPYFIRLGDHKDLTITPFLTTETRTLELRYRQAFRNGRIEFEGALSDDDINTRSTRGYLFGRGEFDLPRDFTLSFDVEAVSDDTYLLDYSYSEKDRLDSEIALERVKRDSYLRGAFTHFQSLRPGESNRTLPTIVGNARYERRLHPARLGGELRLNLQSHSHSRRSGLVADLDGDGWADGRDVQRLTAGAAWRRGWTLPGGVLAAFRTGVTLDHFEISQAGATSAGAATEVTPSAEVELRWPLLKTAATGATHVVEPVLQMSWTGGENPFIPNDENTRIEFDEGNLFSTSRFAAPDRRERGLIGAYGVSWTRHGATGAQAALAVGQLVREKPQRERSGADSFTDSSGLDGDTSDLLVAGQLKSDDGFALTARSLFDEGMDTTKAEARASWQNARTDLGATYIWLGRDPSEDRAAAVSEWAFDTSYRLSRHWTGSANWRYDVASDESVRAGIGLTYTNECVDISLSASRRFTSSRELAPSTDVSLTVGLRGFKAQADGESYMRTCSN
jgi:LPS-assembly protein